MNDPIPLTRLDLLRFLERVQERDLARTRKWISDEERREAERARGEQARPPVPDWIVELGIGQGSPPIEVHRGDCHAAGKRRGPVTRDEARRALADGIRACTHCRPDTALGVLD
ncbi:DUF6233 domain-containing protein [Streptomyces sp. Je 1-369]|uniref:DUF6233 domain-containing protein n=1 Tax=Streptomyces sp. Je 1-369 TaxID=2966192 RepID=UPI002285AE68|nr:DUF6233 domain-containing protein [Streptomyces sp. Je 1-369]WAL93962.1 DUF6233 domain-containing protein [Streptomyces sp. Je 1-369]